MRVQDTGQGAEAQKRKKHKSAKLQSCRPAEGLPKNKNAPEGAFLSGSSV